MTPDFSIGNRTYALSLLFSILFAVAGFSYNVWRMEVTEENNTIRMASFEILLVLAELEQLVYVAHYDGDRKEGNPRSGWVKIGLVSDLSMLTAPQVATSAAHLQDDWSEQWSRIAEHRAAADTIVVAIEQVRFDIKQVLESLD